MTTVIVNDLNDAGAVHGTLDARPITTGQRIVALYGSGDSEEYFDDDAGNRRLIRARKFSSLSQVLISNTVVPVGDVLQLRGHELISVPPGTPFALVNAAGSHFLPNGNFRAELFSDPIGTGSYRELTTYPPSGLQDAVEAAKEHNALVEGDPSLWYQFDETIDLGTDNATIQMRGFVNHRLENVGLNSGPVLDAVGIQNLQNFRITGNRYVVNDNGFNDDGTPTGLVPDSFIALGRPNPDGVVRSSGNSDISKNVVNAPFRAAVLRQVQSEANLVVDNNLGNTHKYGGCVVLTTRADIARNTALMHFTNPVGIFDVPDRVAEFEGDGTETVFDLGNIPTDGTRTIIVSVNGITLDPAEYSIAGTEITFTVAPADETVIFVQSLLADRDAPNFSGEVVGQTSGARAVVWRPANEDAGTVWLAQVLGIFDDGETITFADGGTATTNIPNGLAVVAPLSPNREITETSTAANHAYIDNRWARQGILNHDPVVHIDGLNSVKMIRNSYNQNFSDSRYSSLHVQVDEVSRPIANVSCQVKSISEYFHSQTRYKITTHDPMSDGGNISLDVINPDRAGLSEYFMRVMGRSSNALSITIREFESLGNVDLFTARANRISGDFLDGFLRMSGNADGAVRLNSGYPNTFPSNNTANNVVVEYENGFIAKPPELRLVVSAGDEAIEAMREYIRIDVTPNDTVFINEITHPNGTKINGAVVRLRRSGGDIVTLVEAGGNINLIGNATVDLSILDPLVFVYNIVLDKWILQNA